jgi:predicted Zn-dependent peptidase
MRHLASTMLTTLLLAFALPARAESRATYVTMVLQAFAAKVECPGTDVAYQDLMRKAKEMQQAEGTTEAVRKAIAYMLTGGRMGERGDSELMNEIAIAVQSTDQDQKRLGMPVWCETQKTNLAGFVRTKN